MLCFACFACLACLPTQDGRCDGWSPDGWSQRRLIAATVGWSQRQSVGRSDKRSTLKSSCDGRLVVHTVRGCPNVNLSVCPHLRFQSGACFVIYNVFAAMMQQPLLPGSCNIYVDNCTAQCGVFFLTHAHSDHLKGLGEASWNRGFIHCSHITAKILISRKLCSPNILRPHALEHHFMNPFWFIL